MPRTSSSPDVGSGTFCVVKYTFAAEVPAFVNLKESKTESSPESPLTV